LTTLLERGQLNTILSVFVFMCFILLSAMTVMNMLIGVLCEVVSAVAQSERDEAAIIIMKDSILGELQKYDDDGNGMISKSELSQVMKSRTAIRALEAVDVDYDCLQELQQMLFYGKPPTAEVKIERVMELFLNYRGSLQTTVKHLVDAQLFNRWYVKDQMLKQDERMEGYLRDIRDLGTIMCGGSLVSSKVKSVAKPHSCALPPLGLRQASEADPGEVALPCVVNIDIEATN